MKRHERVLAATALLISAFARPSVSAKPTNLAYVATSNTAMSITGDIDVSSERIIMAGRIALPVRVAAKARPFKTDQGYESAQILRVTKPVNPVLLNKNRLCSGPVKWIVLWHMPDRGLGMAAFSGAPQPHSQDSPGLCGTFYYAAR